MRQRALINIVLLVVVAGLAAFIALAPDQEPRLDLEPLSNEDPHAFSRVRLDPGAGETIELRRADGVWQLVVPMRIAANDFRVNALLGVLRAPVHARIDVPPEEYHRFGLAPAKARVLLDKKEILFGDTEPIHTRRYLLYDGGVALVDDAYFSHLSSSAANYVNLALLGRDPNPRNILLPDLRVYRDAGVWHLESENTQAGPDSITKLVDAWRHTQATAVRPYEQSLDWNESIRVQLDEGELHFDLARTEYELILGRKDLGIQYHVTKSTGTRLLDIVPDE